MTIYNQDASILGDLTVNPSNGAGSILTLDGTNVVKFRAPSEILSDIGAEPSFLKNTAFNKDFGTAAGTVAEGNDSRILNGQSAFTWGNHSLVGYLTSETDPIFSASPSAGILAGDISNWNQTYDNYITGIAVTGTTTKTITLTQRDGGTIAANFTDLSGTGGDGNDFLSSASFVGGTLTLGVTNQSDVTVSFDGRYSLLGHTHVIGDITDFTDNSTNWNTAFGWGDHALEGYLISFDITTQTDPKYLLSTTDTFTGTLTIDGSVRVKTGNQVVLDDTSDGFCWIQTDPSNTKGYGSESVIFGSVDSFAFINGEDDARSPIYTGPIYLEASSTITDYDRFMVMNNTNGRLEYITGTNLRTHIGAQPTGSYLLDTTDTWTGTHTGGTQVLGGSVITSSAAILQVNGFQRTGSVYLHSGGNTPNNTRGADYLWNSDVGDLMWQKNGLGDGVVLHSLNYTNYTDAKYIRSDANDDYTGFLRAPNQGSSGLRFTYVANASTPNFEFSGAYITGGADYAGLSKLNNIAVQTWYGFSVSSTYGFGTVPQGTPAFSVDARTGNSYVYTGLTAGSNIISTSGSVYAGGNSFVFGTSTSEGEYLNRSGNDIRVFAGGSVRCHFDGDTGKVGIGETSPDGQLQVKGNKSTGTDSVGILILNDVETNSRMVLDSNDIDAYDSSGVGSNLYLNDYSGGNIICGGKLNVGNANTTYNLDVTGTGRFTGDVIVPAETYGSGWNGSNEVPTKNDVYDKIENLQGTSLPTSAGANGEIVFWGSSGTFAAGEVVYYSTAGVWTRADADSSTTRQLIGVALGTSAATNGILLRGAIYNTAYSGLSFGLPLYLSNTAGDFTTTAPTGAGDYVRVLGYKVATNVVYFRPDNTWIVNPIA